MTLLTPWWLLGLLSIAVLILIYILKPNYQQKIISSTHVWKLSLKYRKKRIPVSRFRNILIFICQVLILSLCAFLLARPVIAADKVDGTSEQVIIIDASASMMVSYQGETRFERAVNLAIDNVTDTLKSGGVVTVIVADTKAYPIAQRYTSEDLSYVVDELDKLIMIPDELKCSYGSADMEGAVELAEAVLLENPEANVYLYTGTTYVQTGDIEIVPIVEEDEWNAAVLSCEAKIDDDNYYDITVNVGCYGRSEEVTVYCKVKGANGDPYAEVLAEAYGFFNELEEEKTFVFRSKEMQSSGSGSGENNQPVVQENVVYFNEAIDSFESIEVYVEEADSLSDDNQYRIFGGKRPVTRIQYTSSLTNNFITGVFDSLREVMYDYRDIDYEIKTINPYNPDDNTYEMEGFDIYIFEHTVPEEKLPDDGLIIFIDPDKSPKGNVFKTNGAATTGGMAIKGIQMGDPHPLTNMVDLSKVQFSKLSNILTYDGFDVLATFKNGAKDMPVLLAKNDPEQKIVVLGLDLNYCDFSMTLDFPVLFYNIIEYYMPLTLKDFSYQVGDTVTMNAKGEKITLVGGGAEEVFTKFPAEFTVTRPDTYTLTQEIALTGDYIYDYFFVGISNFESNITKEVDALPALYKQIVEEKEDRDLLIWFAAALVAFLFIEWWLQSREYF